MRSRYSNECCWVRSDILVECIQLGRIRRDLLKRLLVRLGWLLNSFVVLLASVSANANSEYNMTQGVTEISGQVYELHMLIFYICCAIAFVVFGVMFYSILRHRKSKGAVAAHFHESTKVEILWRIS